jgi:hypothetical protein
MQKATAGKLDRKRRPVVMRMAWLFCLIFLSVALSADDLTHEKAEEVKEKPWQLPQLLSKHQGPVMDQLLKEMVPTWEDSERLMDPLQSYLNERPKRERHKLMSVISSSSLAWGLRLMVYAEGMASIQTIAKHIKTKDPLVVKAVIDALKGLPWEKEHENVMVALSKKMLPLLEIEDWQMARDVSTLLARWQELEFPVQSLHEQRLKTESVAGRRDAIEKLTLIRQLKVIPLLGNVIKEKDLWSTISRQIPYLLNLEGRTKKEFEALLKMILSLLNEEDFELHYQVVSDLGRSKPSLDIAGILCGLLDMEYGEEVVHHTAKLLQSYSKEVDLQKILESRFENRKENYRSAAVLALGYFDEEWCYPLLVRALKDRREEVLIAATEALCRIKSPKGEMRENMIEALLPKVQTKSGKLGLSAAYALGRLSEAKVLIPLAGLLKKRQTKVPSMALAEDLVGPWGKDALSLSKVFRKLKDPLPFLMQVPAPQSKSSLLFYELKAECSSVTFIMDTSASMKEDGRWKQAKEQLYRCLFSLQMDTLVNLIDYNTKVRLWKDYPVRATWRNKFDFYNHVEKLPLKGKTNINEALMTGLRQWKREAIFFLTDGLPTEGETNTSSITSEVSNRNGGGHVKIYCVGLQVGEAHDFLSSLSRDNGGTFRMVD